MSKPTLDTVNTVLHLFEPHMTLERRASGRLWIVAQWERKGGKPYHAERAVTLNSNGHSITRYGPLGCGGTGAEAIGQLVRWLRGDSRLPLRTWRYWCGRQVYLARENGEALLAALEASGYGDPAKTGCVFCGSPEIRDWWSRDGDPTGPCCSHWGCREREKQG